MDSYWQFSLAVPGCLILRAYDQRHGFPQIRGPCVP